MIYLFTASLYLYLLIKTSCILFFPSKRLSRYIKKNITLREVLLYTIFMLAVFFIFLNKSSAGNNLIISKNLIFTVFTGSIFILGLGVGMRFVLAHIPHSNELNETAIDIQSLYMVYSKFWLFIGLVCVAFTVALVEISSLGIYTSRSIILILYLFSMLAGIFCGILNSKESKRTGLICFVSLTLIGIAILSLMIESSFINFYNVPFSISILIFITIFAFTYVVKRILQSERLKQIKPTLQLNIASEAPNQLDLEAKAVKTFAPINNNFDKQTAKPTEKFPPEHKTEKPATQQNLISENIAKPAGPRIKVRTSSSKKENVLSLHELKS